MGFRRPKGEAAELRAWARFRSDHSGLFDCAGLPFTVSEDRWDFEHFLMHGNHPLDPAGVSTGRMSREQRAALAELIDAYLRAGFPNPGIMALPRSGDEDATPPA